MEAHPYGAATVYATERREQWCDFIAAPIATLAVIAAALVPTHPWRIQPHKEKGVL